VVHAECLNDEETVFDIYDSSGKKVLSKQILVKSGLNQLEFDVTNLPSGFYFVAPATSWGQSPMKFIKIANM
jgi:Secretion system C-terminal sorting domain